jgi:hypothetical protein
VTEETGPWPRIKTARDLVAEDILPCSEDLIRQLAKRHGVGRKLGRTYVFTADDIQTLIERLPRPGDGPDGGSPGYTAPMSDERVLEKARAMIQQSKRERSRRSKS